MKKLALRTQENGFTIIEVMIALAIFTVIVTIGIGAVLDATSAHNRSKNMRTVMDSLNFVMEDMARNIRLGTNIRCVTNSSEVDDLSGTSTIAPQSCPDRLSTTPHNKLIFKNLNGQYQMYLIGSSPSAVYKQTGSGDVSVLTPAEITIDFARSGFTVRGAEDTTSGDFQQPSVTIRLAGTITYKEVDSKFAIETTVTPRQLDQ